MRLREIAEILMVGRRAARQIGCEFIARPDLTKMSGVAVEDHERILQAVREIEQFTEIKLSELNWSRSAE